MTADLPQGPRLPAMAQAAAWVVSPERFLNACRRRFGPVFTLRMTGMDPMVVLAEPSSVKQVLTGDSRIFGAGRANAERKPTTWLRGFGPRSLVLLDGPAHDVERRTMMPALHGERLEAYARSIGVAGDAAIRRWPVGTPFSFFDEMKELVLDVLLRTVFGLDDGPRKTALRRAFDAVQGIADPLAMHFFAARAGDLRGRALLEHLAHLPPERRYERALERAAAELKIEIALRRAGSSARPDVISMLLGARTADGQGLSEESIVDEMHTLVLAGRETTATALTWAVCEILRHSDVAVKLRAELAHGDEYLDAVIREALRRHPVVPILARKTSVPVRVGGRDYAAGTILAPSVYLLHHDAATWPEPERFAPERFLGDGKPSAADFLAFGAGSRRCLGMAFALLTMRIVLRKIMTHAELRVPPSRPAERLRHGAGFALSGGLLVVNG